MILLLGEFANVITAVEIRNAVLIAIGFGLVIACAELWHRSKKNPPVEWTRKLVHFGGGGICLLLPVLIDSFWVALVLATGMCGLFILSKRRGWLQSIHGVDRPTHGTEFYPIVILLLFVFSGDRYWQYIICVLVLAVSDSAAALIGTRFGKFRFSVENETKSVEGSIAFFVVTFLVVLIPLFIWTPLGGNSDAITHYVLTATLLSLLVTCMEIVSLGGTDNLWVPLGSWLVLTKTFQTDVADLWTQNLSFAIMLICLLAVARSSEVLNAGGALVCCLAVYGLWAMGSLDWAIVFFIAFGFYLTVAWIAGTPWQIRVGAAVYSLVPPVLVLAGANVLLNTGNPEGYRLLFGPFLAASCVSLGQASANLAAWKFRKNEALRISIAIGTTLFVTIVVVITSMVRQGFWDLTSLMVICLIAAVLVVASARILPTLPPGEAPKTWLRIRSGCSMVAAVLVIMAQQLLGICALWQPQ